MRSYVIPEKRGIWPNCPQDLPEFCPNSYIGIFFWGGGHSDPPAPLLLRLWHQILRIYNTLTDIPFTAIHDITWWSAPPPPGGPGGGVRWWGTSLSPDSTGVRGAAGAGCLYCQGVWWRQFRRLLYRHLWMNVGELFFSKASKKNSSARVPRLAIHYAWPACMSGLCVRVCVCV